MQLYDVIIIGAGAAGLMCAIEAGKRGKSVLVIEHAEQCGKKILISGGGRCNFTNIGTKPENFISNNPHFCKSALARFTPHDFLELIHKHKIEYYEKKLGQLFCKDSSRQILRLLLDECAEFSVEIKIKCSVQSLDKEEHFTVTTTHGTYQSHALVVATGGLSIPKMGATDFGLQIARQFKIPIVPPMPALVPLTFSKEDAADFSSLAGLSVDSLVSTNDCSFRENILFTHRGLSGPATLQVSSYRRPHEPITINLLPGIDILQSLEAHTTPMDVKNFLALHLPKRLADVLSERCGITKKVHQLSKNERETLARMIHEWEFFPAGTEGFEKAEVMVGGVNTDALSSKTMEAKSVQGLYFIGEVVDVTGWLGGYNFQWAWASGAAAGRSV